MGLVVVWLLCLPGLYLDAERGTEWLALGEKLRFILDYDCFLLSLRLGVLGLGTVKLAGFNSLFICRIPTVSSYASSNLA